MASPIMSLNDILDSFVELVQGKHNQVPSNAWINRNEDNSFIIHQEYHGVVESLYNRYAAVIAIAKKGNGIPLQSHEMTTGPNIKFGRVLLLVDRLCPSKSEPPYGKKTSIDEVLQEGEIVTVEIRSAKQSPDNIFPYFANAAFKIGKKVNEFTLANIRDPLRGTVESINNNQVGVIQFGTYDGNVAKAMFSWENLYYRGEKLKNDISLSSVTPRNTLVFLEVSRWEISELRTNWEKKLHDGGIVFKARIVWLKDDPRPLKSGGLESSQKSHSTRVKTAPTKDAANNPENASLPCSYTCGKRPSQQEQRNTVNAEATDGSSAEGKNFLHRKEGRQNMRGNGRWQHAGGWRDGNGNHSNCADESDGSVSDVSSQSDIFSAEETINRRNFKQKMKNKQTKGKSNKLKKRLNNGVVGTLISVDEQWGLVQVDADKIFQFQSDVAFLYGLKIEGLPLQKLLFRDQVVRVYLEEEKVQVLEYGTPQQPHLIKLAVRTYCEKKSVPREIKDVLESLIHLPDENK